VRKLAVALFAAASVVLFGPLVPAGVAVAAQPQTPGTIGTEHSWLQLDVNSISPQVIDSTTGTVTVAATITNVSDRNIRDLLGQLRIGIAATSETAIANGISREVLPNTGTPFTGLGAELSPGQHTSVDLTVPVSGPGGLAISKPGVYPIEINIDGTPDYGGQARLATDSVLLPVLALPGGPGPANPGGPRPLTVLWPLVDTGPTMLSSTSTGEPVLSDDHLATSLAQGGRLAGLLDAAVHAPSSVSSALCYAIDPDLVDTVTAMTHPYLARTSTGATVAGTGSAAATQWLAELRTQVTGRCVLPLPYADADVAALSRAGAVDLERLAISQEASLAADLKPATFTQLNNVLWPAGGGLDGHTMADLAALGQPLNQTTVLVDPDALSPPTASGISTLTGSSGVVSTRAVSIDALVSDALDGSADRSTIAGAPGTAASQSLLDTQNGIGALLYQSMFGTARNQPMLISPPRRWDVPEAQLQAFLAAVGSALEGNQFATPLSLSGLVGQQPSASAATLNYSPAATSAELPTSLVSSVLSQDSTRQDLQRAMHADPTNPTPYLPSSLLAPLQLDLLRCSSTAWRGNGNAAGAAAVQTAADSLSMLTHSVSIDPSSSVSRASSDSPLPVTVTNNLPVDVTVLITFSGEPGLQPPAPYDAVVPAHSKLPLFIQAKLTRTGRFSLLETLTTPTGNTVLGSAARLELVSTSYGAIILVVSGVAFGALVLLSARRIYRRARSTKQDEAGQDQAELNQIGQDQAGGPSHDGTASDRTPVIEQEPSSH